MTTLFASFTDPGEAERAAAALIDQGARAEDISFVASESYGSKRTALARSDVAHLEHEAKSGITTTTPADAAFGAAKGGTIGIGVGILAAIAALTIPGVGIVIGGGAFATAFAGAIGTTIAGMAAGSVAGYLKDQGMAENLVTHYSNIVAEGGAIVSVSVPTGDIDTTQAESILAKYGAVNVATHYSPKNELDREQMPPPEPMVVESAETHVEKADTYVL